MAEALSAPTHTHWFRASWCSLIKESAFLTISFRGIQGRIQGGDWGAPLIPAKVTFFTMILHNSENSIYDIRPFCRPLFCHSSVVKYTSSLV